MTIMYLDNCTWPLSLVEHPSYFANEMTIMWTDWQHYPFNSSNSKEKTCWYGHKHSLLTTFIPYFNQLHLAY